MHFTFSDTIAGSVVAYQADEDTFTLRTIDGREFEVALTNQTYAEVTRNLGEAYIDATGQMREMLDRGRILFAYGVFYPEGGTTVFEAKRIVFVGRKAQDFVFERPEWWVQQVREIADFYRNAQWPDGEHRLLRLPHADQPRGRQAARARGRRPTRSRGSSTASRRRTCSPARTASSRLPSAAPSTCATTCARSTRPRGSRTGCTASTPQAARRRRSSRPSSATTTTRSRPTSRSTRSPGPRRRSASPATRGSRATSS